MPVIVRGVILYLFVGADAPKILNYAPTLLKMHTQATISQSRPAPPQRRHFPHHRYPLPFQRRPFLRQGAFFHFRVVLLDFRVDHLLVRVALRVKGALIQDYFTNKVCSVGKSDCRRYVTQGSPLRPSESPVHHSAAAFTVTSPGAPNPFTPFKYSGIWLNFAGA